MVSRGSDDGILTLEPFIEAVREGVERAGWELSGLQKTTSHRFEGRWEGESTRSAYLFFHSAPAPEFVSIDVYLDETTQGLTGSIALVVDLIPLGELGDAGVVLTRLSALSGHEIAKGHRRPVTLRLRLDDAGTDAAAAEPEVRFKVRISRAVIGGGAPAVCALAEAAVAAFERILGSAELRSFTEAP